MRRRARGVGAAGLALAAGVPLAAYWATLAPSITWRNGGTDSGDVATAAAVLGLAHPPGYPLFVVLGHAAVRLPPGWEPARAVNLLCALLAAAAAAVAYASCRAFLRSRPEGGDRPVDAAAALAATWALALGPLWWRQANLATAHALNLLLAAVLCAFAVRAERPLGPRAAAGGAFALGLALSHHPTLLAVPLAFAAACVLTGAGPRLDRVRRARHAAALCLAAAAGLSPWALLPVLAASGPERVWGDPTTVPGLVALVSGAAYQENVWALGATGAAARAAAGVRALALTAGPVGLVAVLAGTALAWDGHRRYVVFAGALTALDLAGFAVYAARDVESYLLPAAVAVAPLAARALADAGRRLAARWPAAPAAWAAAAVGTAGLALAANAPTMDLSGDRDAVDFARAALGAAPPRAVLVAGDDRASFALRYTRWALGERPDTIVVDQRMLQWPWYRQDLERRLGRLVPGDGSDDGLPAAAARVGRPLVPVRADPQPPTARR